MLNVLNIYRVRRFECVCQCVEYMKNDFKDTPERECGTEIPRLKCDMQFGRQKRKELLLRKADIMWIFMRFQIYLKTDRIIIDCHNCMRSRSIMLNVTNFYCEVGGEVYVFNGRETHKVLLYHQETMKRLIITLKCIMT